MSWARITTPFFEARVRYGPDRCIDRVELATATPIVGWNIDLLDVTLKRAVIAALGSSAESYTCIVEDEAPKPIEILQGLEDAPREQVETAKRALRDQEGGPRFEAIDRAARVTLKRLPPGPVPPPRVPGQVMWDGN